MFAEVLKSKLAGCYELTAGQIELLQRHYRLLTRWNKALNLTSIRTLEEAVERHYCESVFLAKHLPQGSLSIADLGSGAGFPGIPLAIMRPESSVALIEAHQRKSVFLREATRDLANVHVICRRAGDVEERFEWVVSRAVRLSAMGAELRKLAERAEILGGDSLDLRGFHWEPPIKLPWGERRFLWIGQGST